MNITHVKLHLLSAPLSEPIGNALMFFASRDTLLVEIVAESVSGWGEAWVSPAAAAKLIESNLAGCVLGQNPSHIGRLWQQMREAAGGDAGMAAVAAMDMALHDLMARLYGVPLSTLLGGALRDTVAAYASGPFFKPEGHPYRDFKREIDGYVTQGFQAFKLRSGFNPVDDAAAAISARQQIGKTAALMIDFNQSVTPRNAIATAIRMEEADLLWIEEPASPQDLHGYDLVAGHIKPAIAGGETFRSAAAFLPFLTRGSLDVLQPDIAICGGLTGVGRVAALGELFDRPVIPHVWGSTINFHAALHLTATLSPHRAGPAQAFPYLEYDVGPNPLLELAGRPALNGDGSVTVPTGPGLGIVIDPKLIARITVARQDLHK
ncbi:mandelate racemase/muconate lactonizing enzyme family protein [Agrobacterium rosae]|uniref:Mandelate racemase/muconate lactonizing enzyme C-terminal domain-containing protein n=1 Tax=Agrobacterium rosae TaxID=1972867 RepID=A0AAE5VMB5_9HYPH|nr:mandelate racemase/muconate lactonizing enzyme family protein [Agrobacterium rosae]KAA3509250.1 mandelate racemase/muconate lactonizing enzyme family protein [Agrobacterium rosae]KAA3513946.1 mandelate racemase/muconate lactonizing enzyme family protein [Agrobacterium rosae]MQB50971.1 mandelate racemase/muconate lactonizing enzyme family protein [Agrobacterium rosae]POO48823.1 hypothetical protein CPJ18_22825 [Agrobacterium rosae]